MDKESNELAQKLLEMLESVETELRIANNLKAYELLKANFSKDRAADLNKLLVDDRTPLFQKWNKWGE